MDIGGKYTGTVSGAMNMMGNLGGVVSPIVLGYVVKETGNWNLTFYLTAGLYFVGATLLAVHQLDQAAAAGLRRVGAGSPRAAAPGRRASISVLVWSRDTTHDLGQNACFRSDRPRDAARPRPGGHAHAQGRRADDRDAEHRPVHPDVSGGAEPGRAPRRHLPAARADRHRQDAHRRGAGRGAARQREEGRQDRLRRVPVGPRSRQAHRRASRLSRTPRDAAGADAGEAVAGDLAGVPRLDRAVRRDREGGAGALDAAARHPRSRHADARRQHHRQLRAEPHLPHEQPRRARDDEGDEAGPRLPGQRRAQPRRARQQAREHRRGRGAAPLLARVRQPHRRRHHLPAARRAGAGGDPRSAHRRPAEARQHAPRQPLVRDRDRRAVEAVPARARHQRRVRRARAEAHHPPPPDAAAGRARRQGRRRAGRAGRGDVARTPPRA